MEKTMAKKTKMTKTVRMINNGATWHEVESELGVSRAYLQKLLRTEYYKVSTCYNNLLAKARENEKKKLAKTVIVAETGALFAGFDIPKGVKVVVPEFCKGEIKKFAAKNGRNAYKMINDSNITWVPSKHDGKLIVKVEKDLFKFRSINVVSLACKFLGEGYTVKCVTTSREIFELAGLQKVNPPAFQIVKI